MLRLTFSAPRRQWVFANGRWASQPWSLAGVRSALAGGAWFKGNEDFASEAVRQAALRR